MSETILTMAADGASKGFFASGYLVVSTLLFVALAAIHFYYKSQESFKFASEMPGPAPLPIFGNALMALGKSPTGTALKLSSVARHQTFCPNLKIISS